MEVQWHSEFHRSCGYALTVVRPASEATVISAPAPARMNSPIAIPGVACTSNTATIANATDEPRLTKVAQRLKRRLATIEATGARNGVTQRKINRGWDCVPSHQVGLPTVRLEMASARMANPSTNHERAVTFRQVRVSCETDCGTGGGGISDITLQGTTH